MDGYSVISSSVLQTTLHKMNNFFSGEFAFEDLTEIIYINIHFIFEPLFFIFFIVEEVLLLKRRSTSSNGIFPEIRNKEYWLLIFP